MIDCLTLWDNERMNNATDYKKQTNNALTYDLDKHSFGGFSYFAILNQKNF